MASPSSLPSHFNHPLLRSKSSPGMAEYDGLVLATTDAIRAFLVGAAASEEIFPELRDLAASLSSLPTIPYCSLRSVWSALPVAGRPTLRQLLVGADFVISSPKPREKIPELQAWLRKLAELQERRDYALMVEDGVPNKPPRTFSSYRDQIGFGLHVVLIMLTGYLVGFAASRALFNRSPTMNAAGGILGMAGGMLLETVLFIVRTPNQAGTSSSSPTGKKVH